jgi:hypothetical protein
MRRSAIADLLSPQTVNRIVKRMADDTDRSSQIIAALGPIPREPRRPTKPQKPHRAPPLTLADLAAIADRIENREYEDTLYCEASDLLQEVYRLRRILAKKRMVRR